MGGAFMQQQMFSLTEKTILSLEGKGYRFRVANYNGYDRVLVYGPDWKPSKIKVGRNAAEYLTTRAKMYIAECRRVINGQAG